MKQPFTIGGSVVLRRAISEETGIPLNDEDLTLKTKYLQSWSKEKSLCGAGDKLPIHYQLPEHWHQAVQAVKDFFAEEKFEKGKWYYAETKGYKYLRRYKDTGFNWNYTEGVSIYGKECVYSNEPSNIGNQDIINSLQPATPEQIKFMLGKVAERKGYVKGVEIRSLGIPNTVVMLHHGEVGYDSNKDELWIGGCIVYKKGTWAELLSQEEKFEKGKWYYRKEGTCADLAKISHTEPSGKEVFSEVIAVWDSGSLSVFTDQVIADTEHLQPATPLQIQLMLEKVAESKGYVEGVKVTCLLDDCDEVLDGRYFSYHEKSDSLYASIKDEEGDALIYEKGKWAELLSTEEAKPQTLTLKGVTLTNNVYEGKVKVDIELTAEHIQQLKEAFGN
jgi:hypothetical protein